MSFIRTFHPVGQGAFYTEQHNLGSRIFTIVYDCGSITGPMWRFERKVATALPPDTIIDLLFISHFDADHVNGLTQLRKSYTIKNVVVPLLTQQSRILVKITNYLNYAKFVTSLIDKPEDFFGPNTRIFQVSPVIEGELIIPGEDGTPHLDIPLIDDSNSTASVADAEIRSRNRTIASGTRFQLTNKHPFWEYIPWNYQFLPHQYSFLRLLGGEGISIERYEKIENIADDRKLLKKLYDSLKYQINANAMVVYSGAVGHHIKLEHRSQRIAHIFPYNSHSKTEACLYLGDVELNLPSFISDLMDRLATRRKWICTIQVPHHGAIPNFNSEIMKSGFYAVISFGEQNRDVHPSTYVIGQLYQMNAKPIFVTETLDTSFYSYSK